MAWYDGLLDQGYVPAGVRPKTIQPDGSAQWQDHDVLSKIGRALTKLREDTMEAQKRQQERLKKQTDMYNTLRDSGYQPRAASESVRSGKFPVDVPERPLKEQETLATIEKTKAETKKAEAEAAQAPNVSGRLRERILGKIAAGEELLPGEQQVYNDVIKKEGGGLSDLFGGETGTYGSLKTQVLGKIARGEPLTPGEQQIYDDVFKRGTGSAAPSAGGGEELVSVISPAGVPGKLPRRKLQAALKAGYKTR